MKKTCDLHSDLHPLASGQGVALAKNSYVIRVYLPSPTIPSDRGNI